MEQKKYLIEVNAFTLLLMLMEAKNVLFSPLIAMILGVFVMAEIAFFMIGISQIFLDKGTVFILVFQILSLCYAFIQLIIFPIIQIVWIYCISSLGNIIAFIFFFVGKNLLKGNNRLEGNYMLSYYITIGFALITFVGAFGFGVLFDIDLIVCVIQLFFIFLILLQKAKGKFKKINGHIYMPVLSIGFIFQLLIHGNIYEGLIYSIMVVLTILVGYYYLTGSNTGKIIEQKLKSKEYCHKDEIRGVLQAENTVNEQQKRQLEVLQELRDSDILSEEEYQSRKEKILEGDGNV